MRKCLLLVALGRQGSSVLVTGIIVVLSGCDSTAFSTQRTSLHRFTSASRTYSNEMKDRADEHGRNISGRHARCSKLATHSVWHLGRIHIHRLRVAWRSRFLLRS